MRFPRFLSLLFLSFSAVAQVDNATIKPQGFHWRSALLESFVSTSIAHAIRTTTEDDTQSEIAGPFWRNYFHSIENIHGWDDGDAFYTTYILHPMQGSLAGFIEQQNDPAYRNVEFGASQRYWVGRMRALAFSAAYSTQWTMGPLSEASIGNTQHYDPPGVDDLVVTPILGLAWMTAEDAMDKFVIQRIELRWKNPVVRLLARSTLNPTRSYANLLRLKVPWYRENRGGVFHRGAPVLAYTPATTPADPPPLPEPRFDARAWPRSVAFELETDAVYQRFFGLTGSNCGGGGGRAAVRLSSSWAAVANVGGCELAGFAARNTSGDAFWYLTGARFSDGMASERLRFYLQALAGGLKISHNQVNEQLKAQLTDAAKRRDESPPHAGSYTNETVTNALSVEMGLGITWDLNNGAVIRLCSVDYQHSWNHGLDGLEYRNALRVSAGISFRLGPWYREH